MRRVLPLLLALLVGSPCFAASLKVATWNLEWLTERSQDELPADAAPKRPQDIDALAHYATRLDADIVAIEEVDGASIAARVFTPDHYTIEMAGGRAVQNVGLAIRRGLAVQRNPDLDGLDLFPGAAHPLRRGLDVTVSDHGDRLRILAVHLKSGCHYDPLETSHRRACAELRAQVPLLDGWISAREAEGVAFLIMGDFNRQLSGDDAMFRELGQAGPLALPTDGRDSPCWGGTTFIDHIVAGGPARTWVRADTLRVLVYDEHDAASKEHLSDHCPVSVRLDLP